MGNGFCCPNTTWRSCVGSHVWHRNALDRSTTLRSCHWSPEMCNRDGWIVVFYCLCSFGRSEEAQRNKFDWFRHDYKLTIYIYDVSNYVYHSMIFYVQFCCFSKSNMLTLHLMIFTSQVPLNQEFKTVAVGFPTSHDIWPRNRHLS